MKILCLFGRCAYGDPRRGGGYEYANFWPALQSLASEIRLFDTFDRSGYRDFADLNVSLVREVCAFKPDLIFAVLMHYEVWTETLDLIRRHTPAVILHWGTDDSWKYAQFSRFIARHVDVHVTTDKTAHTRARRSGLGNVVLSQWGASDARLAPPLSSTDCVYDVSFVGAAYGERRALVQAVRDRGLSVVCFGHGWENGPVDAEEVLRIYRQSRISLNFSDASWQIGGARGRQIKARTFEVPGAGGFLLTQAVHQLDAFFDLDNEIVTFEGIEELTARVRHFLAHRDQRDQRARKAHERVVREHTYAHRFAPLIAEAERVKQGRQQKTSWDIGGECLGPQLARHRIGFAASAARSAVIGIARLACGRDRGPRAARRLAFELSWRLAGGHTYSAGGWPGRFFYKES